jgi:leucyl aminopeptidase
MPSFIPSSSTFRGVTGPLADLDVELAFVPVFSDGDDLSDLPGLDAAVGGEWTRAASGHEFTHKPYVGVAARVVAPDWKPRHIFFIGAGKRDDVDGPRWHRVAAACSHVARHRGVTSCAFVLRAGVDAPVVARAAADGLSAAEFDGGNYKTQGDRRAVFPRIVLVAGHDVDNATLVEAVVAGRVVGAAANVARGLVNEPGNVLSPQEFAARATTLVEGTGLTIDVLDEHQMAELGMRLVLAVGQGSAVPPRVIVVRHDPPGAPESPVIGLVGKGVTFDTGGISIKPADSMDRMKHDMAGGAAVVGALCAVAALGGKFRVIGVVPTVENMLGSRAMRPGDVVAAANGKTVEILNTDAEGRLILADALWYAQELGATHLVDVATLTGACMIALGRHVSGLLGSPESWVETVRTAGQRGGDRLWPLPIYEEAFEQLRSEIADMSNIGGRPGGAITAAAFLREFVANRPWAHLDIAGTAWAETKTPYQPKGATGVALRTLIDVAMSGGAGHPGRAD